MRVSDSTVACMATFPARFHLVERAVASLSNQVDHLFLYVNEYSSDFPKLSDFSNVHILKDFEHNGNISANGKVYPLDIISNCLVITVDDDFIYPHNYVECLKRTFGALGDRCVLTLHGSIFPRWPRWYYERATVFSAKSALDKLRLVSLAGSGATAFFQRALPVTYNDFSGNVMVDLKLSLSARERGLPIWTVPRPARWLEPISGEGLWEQFRVRITHHTEEIRKYDFGFDLYRDIVLKWFQDEFGNFSFDKGTSLGIDAQLCQSLLDGVAPSDWNNGLSFLRKRTDYLAVLNETSN